MSAYAGIQATVLQKNIEQFFCDACGNYGQTMNIPCGAEVVEISSETYWAVPEKKDYVQGFTYEIASSAPTYDSIQVFKLTDKTTGVWYWVVGTPAAYFAACAACCDASPAPTIVTSTRNSFTSDQYICADSDGNFYGYWAAPALGSGRYVSVVSKDGTQRTPIQTYATGSTSLANLITYLNTNYSALGVWSLQGSPQSIRLAATEEGWYGFVVCSKTS